MFDNFGKCGPIFNFFHLLIHKTILCVYTKDSQLSYKIQKMQKLSYESIGERL